MMPSPQIPDSAQKFTDDKGFIVTSWYAYLQGAYKAIVNSVNVTNITKASDFPTPRNVQQGLSQALIINSVTDNDPTRTNTGASFVANNYIVWNGTAWIVLN